MNGCGCALKCEQGLLPYNEIFSYLFDVLCASHWAGWDRQ